MAAKTPTAAVADHTGARELNGYQVTRHSFTNVNNADTWASGIPNIREVAWQGSTSADVCSLTFASTGVVTFNGASGTEDGDVLVFRGAAR